MVGATMSPVRDREDLQRAFWERAALAALPALICADPDCTPGEAAGMAAEAATDLLHEYIDRFRPAPETMTYARQEAAVDFKGNAATEAERADHVALHGEESE